MFCENLLIGQEEIVRRLSIRVAEPRVKNFPNKEAFVISGIVRVQSFMGCCKGGRSQSSLLDRKPREFVPRDQVFPLIVVNCYYFN